MEMAVFGKSCAIGRDVLGLKFSEQYTLMIALV